MLSQQLENIFEHKYSFLATAALLIIPAYSWKSFFNYWKRLKREHEHKLLFQQRHNCVVTYQANKGISGWPPNTMRTSAGGDKLFDDLYQPILYFIRTAEQSLDIAIMLLNVNVIYSELVKARKRGVRVRIMCNFQHSDSSQVQIRKLLAEDVEYQFFVASTSALDTIMHHKYIIKDFSEDGGYICMGSMNFTSTSVLNNYESFAFMSNHNVVEAFASNFEECWQNIEIDNKGLINQLILIDAHLDI